MKKLFACFFFVLLFSFYSSLAHSQANSDWQWSHIRPQGNALNWVKVFNGSTWYMTGLSGTFMKTTNAGQTWFFHHKAGHINALVGGTRDLSEAWFFDMNTGIAGGSFGFTRTTNGGVTWDTITRTGTASWLSIDFANSTYGYASGTQAGRFAKTTNGGLSWEYFPSHPSLPATSYFDVCVLEGRKDTLYLAGSGAADSCILRKSTDGGATFQKIIMDPTPGASLNGIIFPTPMIGYAAGSSGRIYRTTNFGVNWTAFNVGPSTTTFQDVVLAPNGEVWLVGDPFNLYKGGSTNFTAVPVPFLAPVSEQPYTSVYNSISFTGDSTADTIVVVGNSGLINVSTDKGVTWRTLTYYKKAGSVQDIWADSTSSRVWGVGAPLNATSYDQVMYSSDGGATWQVQSTLNSSATFNSIHMLNSSTGYIGGTGGRVRKTTNGGATWDSVATGFTFVINNINFLNANTGFVFGASGSAVRRTTNGGMTWDSVGSGVTSATLNSSSFVNSMTGWLSAASGRIAKTTDGGLTWVSQNSNTTANLISIDMIDTNTGFCAGNGVIKYTTNGGAVWDSLLVPSNVTFNGVDFTDRMNGVVVGTSGFTAITNNGGISWSITNTGATQLSSVMMINPDTIYTGGGISVIKYAHFTTGIEFTPQIAGDFHLSQNYPNPFNPETNISFSLPAPGVISLRVYDITGREVSALINNLQLNTGSVRVTFNGSSFASGVYFYSLTADNKIIDTKKMLLLK